MSTFDAIGVPEEPTGLWRLPIAAIRWMPLVIVGLVWAVLARTVLRDALLPSPSVVAAETTRYVLGGSIWPHLLVSLYRVGIGLALAIVVGVALGIGMARVDPVEDFFDVFVTMTYPIPKTALVPLSLLWFGIGTKTAVFVIFLGALIPIVINTYNGAQTVEETLIWSAAMMGTSERGQLRRVVLPATLPNILTGIQQAIPIGFIVLISAELIASRRGMGNLISKTGQFGLYGRMFAVILIFSFVAFLTDRAFRRIRRRVLAWN